MIQAIWPSYIDWHQGAFPPSADITPATLLSCVIFWFLSLPVLYLNTRSLRWVFIAKIATMPFLWVALFTWALTASHGFGPLLRAPSKPMNGMSTGYLFCYAITASSSGANCKSTIFSEQITGAEQSDSNSCQYAGYHAVRTQSSVVYYCTGDRAASGVDTE